MKRIHFENIETINGWFVIYEIGESVFYEVHQSNNPNKYLFHTLASARDFIQDTEISPIWDRLFEMYVLNNEAVN